MTNQFAQPRKGRKATAAKTRATIPIMTETALNIRTSFHSTRL
jgi:hypothetical protein